LITKHQLPAKAFAALASGDGNPAVVRHLGEVQRSKHLMLLHAIAEEAKAVHPGSHEIAAARESLDLLRAVQVADPDTLAWLLGLPHIGAWIHDCLERRTEDLPPDFGYLAAAAAAAAVRARIPFELDVPVRGGRVLFPGLGYFHGFDRDSSVRLRCDGVRLTVGALTEGQCADLMPEDDSGGPVPHWQGTHVVRATAAGRTWTVLLETTDQCLNRFALPMAALTAGEITNWRSRIQSAWEVLVRHHGWVTGSIAAGVSVIVPLAARSDADLDSATTPAAFGAIAASLPSDPVLMAEILVHELQHIKLSGLQDMVPLVERCDKRVYAPWRPDPRPVGGLLQGVYAHLGIARFWDAQRHVETEPDDIFRAQVTFERSRSMIESATATLLRTDCLTPTGTRFVSTLRDKGKRLGAATVPADVRAIAREATLDHWLTWQLRHAAIDATTVAQLAAAYQDGEPLSGLALPEVRIEEERRKVAAATRSRVLNMRFLEPQRYRELREAGMPELSEAERFLISGQTSMAVQAYRDEISVSPEPLPEAWTGLALSIHLLAETPLLSAFATRLPLMVDLHACLLAQGVMSDPLELAAWMA
jgi:HEXXH motif-containing protein